MSKSRIHITWFSLVMLVFPAAFGGPYPPRAGVAGSTAIAASDSSFVSWADTVVDIQYGDNVIDTWRTPEKALGPADGTSKDIKYIVSLGEGGVIVLSFPNGIGDGDGYDFAVFENSFSDTFLELAYVEVSTNGTDYVRFPNDSLTPYPVSSYGTVDPSDVDGLAGKYRRGFGTPFDLADLAGVSENLNLARVLYVRLVDVVGDGFCLDSYGNPIYDPYPGQDSAGFDLDAVGVIHEAEAVVTAEVSLNHEGFDYPGPVSGEGEYEVGATVSWSVSSPWPDEDGENGHRWIADVSSGSFAVEADTVITVTWQEQVLFTIESEYAEPVGEGWYDVGSTVDWNVPSMVLTTDGKTRHQVSSNSSGQVTLDEPMVITVSWKTEHLLDLEIIGDGLVTPEKGFYSDMVQMTATDLMDGDTAVCVFSSWTGDVVTGSETARTITVPMDSPKTLTATFSLNPAVSTTETTSELLPGWNLVTPPCHLADTRTSAIFGDFPGGNVWAWEATGHSYVSCRSVHKGAGYWVLAMETTPVVWAGAASSWHRSTTPGWNLLAGNEIGSEADGGTTLWSWNAVTQAYEPASQPQSEIAYWFFNGGSE